MIVLLIQFPRDECEWLSALWYVERNPEELQFKLNDDTEKAIASAWNSLSFDNMQSDLHNWSHLAWLIKNDREYIPE
jgi:hypothetical protein